MIDSKTKVWLWVIAGLVLLTGGVTAFWDVVRVINIERFAPKEILNALVQPLGVSPAFIEALFVVAAVIGVIVMAWVVWGRVRNWFGS